MELQQKPCPPTASSWFITMFSSFLFGLDFATLLMFIIFSFLVIPPIVFGILFWSLLLAIVFFLRRRDHHCGIDWWWWKTPHKFDPVCSPGTFTHNKASQTYQTQTPTHPWHLLQNHVLLGVQKATKQTVTKLHSQTSSPLFLPSSFSFTPLSSSSTYNHKHLHVHFFSTLPSCFSRGSTYSPAPSLQTLFNCLSPEDVFTFVWDTGCSCKVSPQMYKTLWTDLTLLLPIPKSWALVTHLSVAVGTVEWVVSDNNRQPYTIRTSALLVPASRTRLLSTQSYLKGTSVFG